MNPVVRGLTFALAMLVLAMMVVAFLANTFENVATHGHEVDQGTMLP